jgi:hypothetical protein
VSNLFIEETVMAQKKKKLKSKTVSEIKESLTDKNTIVYGGRCTWWGTVAQAKKVKGKPNPCCPHCQSEKDRALSEEAFLAGLKERNVDEPGHKSFVLWMKGKCYESFDAALKAKVEKNGGCLSCKHSITSGLLKPPRHHCICNKRHNARGKPFKQYGVFKRFDKKERCWEGKKK